MSLLSAVPSAQAPVQLESVRRTLTGDFLPVLVDLEQSRGSYLVDSIGERSLLDMGMFFSSSPLGHNPDCLTSEAAGSALKVGARFKPSNPDFASAALSDFVQAFGEWMMPGDMSRLFLIDGGGAAVENALKIAFDWKAKTLGLPADDECSLQVLHLERAFHGRTGYTMSLTNTDPAKTARFPKFNWPRIAAPALDENGGPGPDSRPTTTEEDRVLHEVEALVGRNGHKVACFVYEPIQGEGGDRHLGAEFLRRMQEVCHANDVLVVADEVQTGGGLTGARWAHETMDLEPDLIAFGKRMQVCGVIGGRRLEDVSEHAFVETSRISSTWGGSLVDMIRFTHLYRYVFDHEVLSRVVTLGPTMRDGLERVVEHSGGHASAARSRGLFGAVTLSTSDLRNRVIERALVEYNCILLPCGQRSIRWRPSLLVTAEELRTSFDIVSAAIGQETRRTDS